MSALFGSGAPRTAATAADLNARKEQVMAEVRNQLGHFIPFYSKLIPTNTNTRVAVANAQQLIENLNGKCYSRSVLSFVPLLDIEISLC